MKFLSCLLIAAMHINLSIEYLSGELFLLIMSLSLIWMPLLVYVLLFDDVEVFKIDRKCPDYVCVKGEYQSILQKFKHYLRHENKAFQKVDWHTGGGKWLIHGTKHCKNNQWQSHGTPL